MIALSRSIAVTISLILLAACAPVTGAGRTEPELGQVWTVEGQQNPRFPVERFVVRVDGVPFRGPGGAVRYSGVMDHPAGNGQRVIGYATRDTLLGREFLVVGWRWVINGHQVIAERVCLAPLDSTGPAGQTQFVGFYNASTAGVDAYLRQGLSFESRCTLTVAR